MSKPDPNKDDRSTDGPSEVAAQINPGESAFPEADLRAAPHASLQQVVGVFRRYWWAMAAAALFVVILVSMSWWSQGTLIRIHFDEGHGIKPGDALLYRGIEVGRVERVHLKTGGHGLYLDIRLSSAARHLAREETQFWIVRPQVSLARVRGLETVVGAKYVAVLPGPEGGPTKREFLGSETPIWLDDAGETELIIDFRDGKGLNLGDPLRYRGIDIGEVMGISLGSDLQTVQVRIRLTQAGTQVASAGSQFWIEHPDVSFAGVRGLETIVGGRYVAVVPGPPSGQTQRRFVGLEEPPAARDRSADGLEILLTSSHRRGLKRGVDVTYRGLPIGRVISVGLASDALTVEARVYIQPRFKHLVRHDSKFWNMGGMKLDAGVSGVEFRLDSVESLLRGSIAMATPEELGDPVNTGYRFEFHDEPDKDWLEWKPQIPVGAALLSPDSQIPIPQRAQLRWQTRRLGFRRTERKLGWILPLDSQQLLGLSEVLVAPEDKREEAVLEIEGNEYSMGEAQVKSAKDAALAELREFQSQHRPWPKKWVRVPEGPEDCLVVAGDSSSQVPLAAGRLQKAENGWSIDTSLSFDETDWHGACVVAAADRSLVGLLKVEDGTGHVVFVPQELLNP